MADCMIKIAIFCKATLVVKNCFTILLLCITNIFGNSSQLLSTFVNLMTLYKASFLLHLCIFFAKDISVCKSCQRIGISCPQMSIEPKPDFASLAFAVLQYAFRGGREVLVEVGRIILWVGEVNLKWVVWCSFWHKEISGLRKPGEVGWDE